MHRIHRPNRILTVHQHRDPDLGGRDHIDIHVLIIQALKESVRIMRGKKGKLFYLQLSFIGIYLLGAIACGIGLLWVIPYMQVTMANFYRKITGEV